VTDYGELMVLSVVIRTVLGMALQLEGDGRRPWQRGEEAVQADSLIPESLACTRIALIGTNALSA
jgi:hypothetical protein